MEVKLTSGWDRKRERAMRDLSALPGIQVEWIIGVYMGERAYRFDELDVWPLEELLRDLHAGEIF